MLELNDGKCDVERLCAQNLQEMKKKGNRVSRGLPGEADPAKAREAATAVLLAIFRMPERLRK